MICRNRPQFNGQSSSTQMVELLGMHFEWKVQLLCALQDPAGLRQIKSARLAEHIHEGQGAFPCIAEPPVLELGQPVLAKFVCVIPSAALEFCRDGMRA